MEKITLTKMSGEKSHETSLEIGQSVIGYIEEGSVFPKEPTVGRPFVLTVEIPKQLSGYRTSEVVEILSANTFRTYNSIYKWEKHIG